MAMKNFIVEDVIKDVKDFNGGGGARIYLDSNTICYLWKDEG